MVQGTVKWFNSVKGFGFLTQDGGITDIFVHYTQIVSEGYRNLKDGQRVEFDLVESDKGPCAHNVKAL